MTLEGPPLWRVERSDAALHILGGRPPLPTLWTAARAEALLAESTEFWHETPQITPESQLVAFRHGVDAGRPLDSFLTPSLRSRVADAAAELGVAPALLAPMRPWLASQVLRGAADARLGLDRAAAPESAFRSRAIELGLPVKAEFPSVEALMHFFGTIPAGAETEMLAFELDELEAHPSAYRERAEAWFRGDIAGEEERAHETSRRYPALYEHLVVARNRAWVPRIEAMLEQSSRAFIVIGLGHMLGPDSVVSLLEDAGVSTARA